MEKLFHNVKDINGMNLIELYTVLQKEGLYDIFIWYLQTKKGTID